MPERHSWRGAFRAAGEAYGKTVTVPKAAVGPLPSRFEPSPLSLSLGANAVYRDDRPTDSFQVRAYEDRYTVQLDRHNPDDGSAVRHAFTDAAAYTVPLAAAVAAGWVALGEAGE